MTKRKQIYKCNICGNIVEVLFAGMGELVCCGEPMNLMEEKSTDSGQEKHVPVLEKTEKGVRVKVGDVPHPMEEKHFIQWIEVIEDCGIIHRAHLEPGDKPEAHFELCCGVKQARSYCNVHGHWKGN